MQGEKRKRYRTLLNELEKIKQYPLLMILAKDKSTRDQVIWLEELLHNQAKSHIDAEALMTFTYWTMAKTDQVAEAFTENTGQGVWRINDGMTEGEIHDLAREAIFMGIKELWPKIPMTISGKKWVRTDTGSGGLEECNQPAVSILKRAMLETVADCWMRATTSNEIAEQAFAWLLDAHKMIPFQDERKMFLEVMKVATNSCPKERLAHAYVTLLNADRAYRTSADLDELTRHIGVGWVRRPERDQGRDFIFRIINELAGASPAAYEYVIESAEKIKELDAATRELTEVFRIPTGYPPHLKVKIRYLAPDSIEIIYPEGKMLAAFGCLGGDFDENHAHDRFAELRDKVKEWREFHRSIHSVTFTYKVIPECGDDPLFERTQEL